MNATMIVNPLTLPTAEIAKLAGYDSAAQWRAAAKRLGIEPVDPGAKPQRWSVAEVRRRLDRVPEVTQNEDRSKEAFNDKLLGLA